jgi:hypothetical protein
LDGSFRGREWGTGSGDIVASAKRALWGYV